MMGFALVLGIISLALFALTGPWRRERHKQMALQQEQRSKMPTLGGEDPDSYTYTDGDGEHVAWRGSDEYESIRAALAGRRRR